MPNIDLHIHTNASDGELSPEEVVDEAIKQNLKAVAITDHDTTSGIESAINYFKNKKIKIVPGIEISCYEKNRGFEEVHVLGLFIEHKNKELVRFTEKIKKDRIEQKKKIIKKLNKSGLDIKFEEIKGFSSFSVGRPHIARALIKKYPNKFSSVKDVFDKYIGVGKLAYVDREYQTKAVDAIKIIKKAQGVAILAHPGVYNKKDSLELIKLFLELGGEGIETFYPYHKICPELKLDKKGNDKLVGFYRGIAKRLGIIESGGSDFHGNQRPSRINEMHVPLEILKRLINAAKTR
ncbi:PHP domain-containing protein [Candidatus Woesearchaeota archaeon]|nr:PHP domain-containing protein [Candidatus Woesearchaeota archaeon]